jgi:hypothetical protein
MESKSNQATSSEKRQMQQYAKGGSPGQMSISQDFGNH